MGRITGKGSKNPPIPGGQREYSSAGMLKKLNIPPFATVKEGDKVCSILLFKSIHNFHEPKFY